MADTEPKDPKSPPDDSSEKTKNLEKLLSKRREEIELLLEKIEILKETAQTDEDQNEIEEKSIELKKKTNSLNQLIIKQQRESGNLDKDKYNQQLKLLRQEEKDLEVQKKRISSLKSLEKGWGGVVASQMLATTGIIDLIGATEGLTAKEIGQTAVLSLLKKSFNELTEAQMQAAKSGHSFIDIYSNFSSQGMGELVGLTRQANGELGTMTRFGIAFKELQQAENNLRDGMIGFSDASLEARQIMKGNAAQMNNLGVSIDTSAKNYDFLTKSLKMTGKQAVQTNDMLARSGLAAGISVKKMLSDFSQIGPQLAAQGPKATEIFTELAKQAKYLGLEVSNLLGIVGSAMDTFEGAANAAGRFNAVMGGDYLNSIELLNASESERVQILKRSMEATGKSFETMGKQEKMAIANALGVRSVDEAQRLFAGSSEEMRRKQEKQAETEERLNQLKEEAVSIGSRLASMFQAVAAVAAPFVVIIEMLAKGFTILNDKTAGMAGLIVTGLLMSKMMIGLNTQMRLFKLRSLEAGLETARESARITALEARVRSLAAAKSAQGRAAHAAAVAELELAKAQSAASKGGGWFSIILQVLPLVIMLFTWLHDVLLEPHSPILMNVLSTTLPAAFSAIGNAAASVVKPLLAFGAAVLMIGGGIFLAAYGMAQLVKAFAGLNPAQILGAVAALIIFSITITGIMSTLYALAMSGVGPIAVGLLLGLGAAFVMIGAGIWLAAQGMSTFVDAIVKLSSLGVSAAITIAGIAASMIMLSVAIGLVTMSMFGLMGLGVGLLPLALGVMATVAAIKALSAAFQKFPSEKSIQFNASTDSLKSTLKQIKELKSDDIKPTLEVLKGARQYLVEVSQASKAQDPIVKLLTSILDIASKSTSKKETVSGPKDYYEIKIDEKVFGQLVRKESGTGQKASGKLAGVS